MHYSTKWKNWIAQYDEKACKECKSHHGKIYEISEQVIPSPPMHPNCRCIIQRLKSIFAGEATDMKIDGADWYLKYKGKLPKYYIFIEDAYELGWNRESGNLHQIAPNKMIYAGRYNNRDEHLPVKKGRVWNEVDINYYSGYRNSQRIVYSNDGLMFVTYDHYKSFIEIR